VESDKASMEIPSSHAGVVKELKVKLGDKVKAEGTGRAAAGGRGRRSAPRQPPLLFRNKNSL
jgi:pyruvate/2-oxoglutarate dehydrogenase complex dihydrolipoamide acyltransferase (E2) component